MSNEDFTPVPASQSQLPTLPGEIAEKKPNFFKKHWPIIAVAAGALIVGAAIGGAGGKAEAEPAPAKTVTVTEGVAADDGCRDVADELFSMLETQTNEVVIPLSESGSKTIDAILAGDIAGIEAQTEIIEGVTESQRGLTDRLIALTPDYQACIAG